jgi:hypothetical protein
VWHDISERREAVRNRGYGRAVDLLRSLCDDLFDALNGLSGEVDAYKTVLIGLTSHSLTTLHAVADLVEVGHSAPAVALHRSLFELMIHARWLRQEPEDRSQRYIRYDHLWRWYALGQLDDSTPKRDRIKLRAEAAEGIAKTAVFYGIIGTDEERAACIEDPASFADALRRKMFRGGKIGTWHGRTIAELVEDVKKDYPSNDPKKGDGENLERLYRMVYPMASNEVHPSPRSVGGRFEQGVGPRVNVDVGPDPRYSMAVASSSYTFVYSTFQVLDEAMDIQLDERLERSSAIYDELQVGGWLPENASEKKR